MKTGKLRDAAVALEGLETGRWLSERLAEVGKAADAPRALVLVSARRDAGRLFPGGLKLHPGWVIVEGVVGPEFGAAVRDFDLIIWVMSALKLFPADYALVLETARGAGIPIWAVVAGTELLGEPQTFIEKIVPQSRARLPEHSEIILCEPQDEEVLRTLRRMLASSGPSIVAAGHVRRKSNILEGLRAHLSQERRAVCDEMDTALDLMDTARMGVESLRIMTGVAAREIFGDFRSLEALMNGFQRELEESVTWPREAADIDSPRQRLERRLSEMRSQVLEKEIERQRQKGLNEIGRWCEEASTELRRFFGPFKAVAESQESLERALSVRPEEAGDRLQPAFDAFRQTILDRFDNFSARIEKNFLMKLFERIRLPPAPARDRTGSEPYEPPQPRPYVWQEPEQDEAFDRHVAPPEARGYVTEKLAQLADHVQRVAGIDDLSARKEEESALSLLAREGETLRAAIAESVGVLLEKGEATLCEIVQRHADASLDAVSRAVTRPRAKLKRLDQADQVLRGDR